MTIPLTFWLLLFCAEDLYVMPPSGETHDPCKGERNVLYINSLLSILSLYLRTELQLNLNSLAWNQVRGVLNTCSGSCT